MRKFKKALALLLVAALSAGVAVNSTLAYLQDEDSAVNVMTLGNVDIEQIEQEWNADKTALQDFTQAKPLYPYVGELGWAPINVADVEQNPTAYRRFSMNNVVDKYVSVQNVGKSDAYVRTLIALEMGEYETLAEFAESGIGISTNAENGAEFQFEGAWNWTNDFMTEINGQKYNVMVAVHKAAVKPEDTTIPSLLQVYLDKNAGNEEVEKLDGNNNGLYDILVLSQAVQTAGFENAGVSTFAVNSPSAAEIALDTAFGKPEAIAEDETTKTNAAVWFEGACPDIPNVLYSYVDINAKKGMNGSYLLGDDISAENIIHFGSGSNVTLDLNGKTITAENVGQYAIGAQQGAKLHMTGNGTVDMGKGFYANKGDAEIIIDGGTYNMTVTGTLNNIKHNSLAQNNSKIVINGGTFTSNVEDAVLFFATSNATIEVNGGFFENTVDATPDLFSMGKNSGNTNRIIIKGGTFVNWNPLEDRMCYTGTGSYEQLSGPWMVVREGYTVVSETQANGDIWYTVVKA